MTDAPNRQTLAGRFKPFDGDRKAGLAKREFENSQLRVYRIIATPGAALNVNAPSGEPSLLVVIAGAGEFSKGQTFWLPPGRSKQFEVGQDQTEILRFDFKTKPKKR